MPRGRDGSLRGSSAGVSVTLGSWSTNTTSGSSPASSRWNWLASNVSYWIRIFDIRLSSSMLPPSTSRARSCACSTMRRISSSISRAISSE